MNRALFRSAVFGGLAALVLSGCGVESDAKKAVKGLLNDPESAVFDALKKNQSGENVCGLVNAKNRMGGYVGKTPFYYEGKTKIVTIAQPVDDLAFRSLWSSLKSKSDATNEFSELMMKCHAIDEWKTVCDQDYPAYRNELCTVMTTGKGAEIFKTLNEKFKSN